MVEREELIHLTGSGRTPKREHNTMPRASGTFCQKIQAQERRPDTNLLLLVPPDPGLSPRDRLWLVRDFENYRC